MNASHPHEPDESGPNTPGASPAGPQGPPEGKEPPPAFPLEVHPSVRGLLAEVLLGALAATAIIFGLTWVTGVGSILFRIAFSVGVGVISAAFYILRYVFQAPAFVRFDEREILVETKLGSERYAWETIAWAAHRSSWGLRWEFFDAPPPVREDRADGEDEDDLDDDDEPEPSWMLRDDGYSAKQWSMICRAIRSELERREIPVSFEDSTQMFDD